MSRREKRAYPSAEPLLVNATDVAKMLSISKTTLWRLRASGRLPRPIRLGGSIRWRVTEIRSWIEKGHPDRQRQSAIGGVRDSAGDTDRQDRYSGLSAHLGQFSSRY